MQNLKSKPLLLLFIIALLIAFVLTNYVLRIRSAQDMSAINRCIKECNVVLIVEDTLSAKHMGLYGNDRDTTPFMDKFFTESGLVYTDMWSTTSWTWPSFASFLRSKYPSEITADKLMHDDHTVVALLRKAGIQTAAVVNEPGNFIVESIRNVFHEDELYNDQRAQRGKPELQNFSSAKAWLIAHASDKQRSFLLVHDATVHDPYAPPEQYRTLFGAGPYIETPPLRELANRDYAQTPMSKADRVQINQWRVQYDQELRYMDDMVKDMIEGLPDSVLQNTVFILMADHGEAFAEHGKLIHSDLHEEVIHVPFLVRIPGLNREIKVTTPHSLIGLTPTLLSLMGVDYSNETFSGKAFAFDGTDKPGIIRAEWGTIPSRVVTSSNTTLSEMHLDLSAPMFGQLDKIALRDGNIATLIDQNKVEAYQLDSDPHEESPVRVGARKSRDPVNVKIWSAIDRGRHIMDEFNLFSRSE